MTPPTPMNHLTTCTCVVLMLLLSASACRRDDEQPPPVAPDSTLAALPYRFDAPDLQLELDNELREVSGLTYLGEGQLGAVQDEEGNIYMLDATTGNIMAERDFWKDGDFEGIARVGKRLYILQSDGDLFVVADWQDDSLDEDDTRKVETWLDETFDTEGLAYDARENRLLIACKENAGERLEGKRAIYAFDLETEQVSRAPVFVISVQSFLDNVPEENAVNDAVRSFLRPMTDLSGFKPSAVAVHPSTGDVYLLSSARPALIVLGRDGRVRHVWPLSNDFFPQPEGLAFEPDGTLYISTEHGDGKAGGLFRFDPEPSR